MINNSYYIKKFKEFLRKEGVAAQFYVNCYISRTFPISSVDKMLKLESFPIRFVSAGFTWSYSKEGHMFWLEVKRKWEKFYEALPKRR